MTKRYQKTSSAEAEAQQATGILWLVEGVVTLPRLLRILVTMLLTLAVTLATFPVMTVFFRLVAWLTNNPDIILTYLFTQNRATLYGLLAVSAGIGFLYYVVGYRLVVGTRGQTPTPQLSVLWYFLVGVVAVVICSVWLVNGILTGAATV